MLSSFILSFSLLYFAVVCLNNSLLVAMHWSIYSGQKHTCKLLLARSRLFGQLASSWVLPNLAHSHSLWLFFFTFLFLWPRTDSHFLAALFAAAFITRALLLVQIFNQNLESTKIVQAADLAECRSKEHHHREYHCIRQSVALWPLASLLINAPKFGTLYNITELQYYNIETLHTHALTHALLWSA